MSEINPTHVARVRFLRAAITQRILDIPPDVSRHSRAVRIGKIREKVRAWADWMGETRIYSAGCTAVISHDAEEMRWNKAQWAAWDSIEKALKAGDDLAAFLFPSEVPS
jgi:hypothetical protein